MHEMYDGRILVILDKIEKYRSIEGWAKADIESFLKNDYDITKAFLVFLRRCYYFSGPEPALTGVDKNKEFYDIVKNFLECGASAVATDVHGLTPTIYIVMMGDVEVLKLLVEHGVDVQARVPQCPSLIVYAEHEGHNDILEFLSRKILPRGGQMEFCFNFGD
ncbi:MAG: hypothetical protein ACD_59C00011G0003 [uncultured bacterium]|nr:MAG: hypothetical protein ACD_59C00011G0003 [uncultured bacterium]